MADMVADMEVDMVADMEVDMVADMEVDKVADMVVDMVADKVANQRKMPLTSTSTWKFNLVRELVAGVG